MISITQNQKKFLMIAGVVFVALYVLRLYFGQPEGFQSGVDSFTMYYADWCPHCQTVKPAFKEWSNKGSIQVNGKTVFLQMVEAEKDADKAVGKPVKGYPTFLLETAGGKFKEFDGERTPQGWESWLAKNL
jgi:thiol-disulfide isomerase/thioredoxin